MKTLPSKGLAFLPSLLLAGILGAQQVCTIVPFGTGCGPVLTGSITPIGNTNRVSLTINAEPRTPVVLSIGINETKVPLFNTGCFLLTELAFTLAHRTGFDGKYTFEKSVSAALVGTVRFQFVEVDLDQGILGLRTTNGLHMVCNG